MKRLVMVLLVALILLSLSGCGAKAQEKYSLYVGLNDASGKQILTVDEAQERARKVITDTGCGYTEYVAYGAYTEDGNVIGNDTLVYVLFYVSKETTVEIADTIKSELNLASVLIEEDASVYYFAD